MALWTNKKKITICFSTSLKMVEKNKPQLAHLKMVFLYWAYANLGFADSIKSYSSFTQNCL